MFESTGILDSIINILRQKGSGHIRSLSVYLMIGIYDKLLDQLEVQKHFVSLAVEV